MTKRKPAVKRRDTGASDFESPEETLRRAAEDHKRHWKEVLTNPRAHGFTSEQAERLAAFFTAGQLSEAEAKELAAAHPLWEEYEDANHELKRFDGLQPAIGEDGAKREGVQRRRQALAKVEARLQALNSRPLRPDQREHPIRREPRADAHEWKQEAQRLARDIIAERARMSLFPSQVEVADNVAEILRGRGICGPLGKPMSGAYIKRHALKGTQSDAGQRQLQKVRQGK